MTTTEREAALAAAAEEVRRRQDRVDYLASYRIGSPAYMTALAAVATARTELRRLGGDRAGRAER